MKTKLVIAQYLVDVPAGLKPWEILDEAQERGDLVELQIEDAGPEFDDDEDDDD